MSEEKQKSDLTAFMAIKAGMTRIFDKEGNHVPVTVVRLIPNVISQVKTLEKDKYEAYQVAFYEKRPKLIKKSLKGHLTKGGIEKTFSRFTEIRMEEGNTIKDLLGKEVTYGSFSASTYVDVTGVSKGKGFQGVQKRHNFAGGPATHGSHFHRRPGSIGNRATPARVFAQKKMPGHMGDEKVTVQNLVVVGVNLEKGYMLIRGAVPGSKNGFIRISKALKKV